MGTRAFKPLLRELRRRVARAPDRAGLLVLSAEAKRAPALGLFSEALEDLERAAALAPDSARVHGCRAKVLAQAGRLGEAVPALDRALALSPRSSPLLAERSFLRAALGRFGPALSDARAACRLAPGSYEARLALAGALTGSGRFPEAAAALDAALSRKSSGGSASLPGSPRPAPWSLRFELLRVEGRFAEAAESLARAVSAGERLFWPSAGEEPGRALAQVEAALALKPRLGWLHFWKGELLLRLDRDAAAEAALTRAVKLGCGSEARAWRGWARRRLNRPRAALGDFDSAARGLGPGPAEARLRLLCASCLSALGRGAAAERTLSAAAKRWPSAEVFLGRARARLALRRAADADADLRRALESDPSLGAAYECRAKIRRARGDAEGARSDRARARRPGVRAEAPLAPFWSAGPAAPPAAAPPRAARSLGRVCVDPRIELAGLLQTALERPRESEPRFARELAPELTAYVEEARRRFVPRLPSELVARFAATARSRGNAAFPWLGVTQMMMGVSPAPELAVESPAWRDAGDLALLEGLRRFGDRSGFFRFCASWSGPARRWTRPMARIVETEAYAGTVSDYLGVEVDAYYDVVLAPLLRGVSLRAILLSDSGRRGARTVFCPLTSDALLRGSVLAPSRDELLWTGWHELIHMRVDPWSEFYDPETEPFRALYARVPARARRRNWQDCFSEHHVRAVTQRLLRARSGAAAQETLARQDRDEGYLFQDALAESLAAYEKNRARFPTLFDYFPEWLKTWRSLR